MNIEFVPTATREIRMPTKQLTCYTASEYDTTGDLEDSLVCPWFDHKNTNFLNHEIQKYQNLKPSSLEAVKINNTLTKQSQGSTYNSQKSSF